MIAQKSFCHPFLHATRGELHRDFHSFFLLKKKNTACPKRGSLEPKAWKKLKEEYEPSEGKDKNSAPTCCVQERAGKRS